MWLSPDQDETPTTRCQSTDIYRVCCALGTQGGTKGTSTAVVEPKFKCNQIETK